MTLKELIRKGGQELRRAKIDHPLDEAELLLAYVTGKPREYLLAHPEDSVPEQLAHQYDGLIKRRQAQEPIAYITGHKDFFGRSFVVDPNVLIPRHDTEVLIEQALEELASVDPQMVTILDIGTGSGAIGLTLAAELEGSHATLVDKSTEALSVAKTNAGHLDVAGRTEFEQLDIFADTPSPIISLPDYLVLTANLPYLTESAWEDSPPKIKLHEPKPAFVSGADGLDHYRALMQRLRVWTPVPDLILLEADPPQFPELMRIVSSVLPEHQLSVHKDLAGLDRILVAKKYIQTVVRSSMGA